MVPLDDHFDAFLDLCKDGIRIAGEIGVANVQRSHITMILLGGADSTRMDDPAGFISELSGVFEVGLAAKTPCQFQTSAALALLCPKSALDKVYELSGNMPAQVWPVAAPESHRS